MSMPFPCRGPKLNAVASLTILLSCSAAHAEIDYHLKVKPEDKKIEVEIIIPARGPLTAIQIPNWSPGAYSYGNFYESVHDVGATDSKGTPLPVNHPDKNTWTVASQTTGPITFKYWVPIGGRRAFLPASESSFVQISGPSTYMYVVGRKLENCKVHFEVPPSWPVMTGLDEDPKVKNGFVAPTYDVLADGPVSTGDMIIDHYRIRDRDHYIVLEGAAKNEVDREKLLKDCKFVSAAETDFFGGAPYHKYVWHFVVFPGVDGAGGLEHLSSTQISLSSGVGPGAQSVLAHEYFHLWNVKRIRASVLGPFDYLTLPKTGALWWLEGVTDYYASLIPYRYGEWTQEQFMDSIAKNLAAIRNNPAHLEVSANEASLRVGDANEGRGNSNGYRISYYNLGWMCGLLLDTQIRYKTNNRHSLDDVVRALYDECKDGKPGFAEDEIRKQCIRFGGQSLGEFYDKVVMTPGDMPVEEQLAKMGFKLQETEEAYVDPGFIAAPSRSGKGMTISAVSKFVGDSLRPRDNVLAINGHRVDTADMTSNVRAYRDATQKAAVGTPISLEVAREDGTKTITLSPSPATRKLRTIVPNPTASPSASSLGASWLKTRTLKIQ